MKEGLDTRSDIEQAREEEASAIERKIDELRTVRDDLEKVRQTLRELDLRGTREYLDDANQHMDGAKRSTVEVFDRKSDDLAREQGAHQDTRDSLGDKEASDESDRERIAATESSVDTKETVERLEQAKETAVRDIEFLGDEIRKIEEELERSRQEHRDLSEQVHDDGD